jgi:hypothetical protein
MMVNDDGDSDDYGFAKHDGRALISRSTQLGKTLLSIVHYCLLFVCVYRLYLTGDASSKLTQWYTC